MRSANPHAIGSLMQGGYRIAERRTALETMLFLAQALRASFANWHAM